MLEWLHDVQLQWVVDFIRDVATRVPLDVVVHGDLYALRAKIPHGPIANARVLLNFTTMWKLIAAHITYQYVPLLAQTGVFLVRNARCMLLLVWRISSVCYTTSYGSVVLASNASIW